MTQIGHCTGQYCPRCNWPLRQGFIFLLCSHCEAMGFAFQFTEDEAEGGTTEMKDVQYSFTHNKTIVEFRFITRPKKGFWKAEVQPTIDLIKSKIPATQREFNPNTQKWSIAVEFWPATEQLLKLMQFNLSEVAPQDATKIPGVEVPEDYAKNFHYEQEVVTTKESATSIAEKLSEFLGVKITTQEVTELKKLYRKRALELHPDRGGDAAKMSELNRLWTLYTAGGVQ